MRSLASRWLRLWGDGEGPARGFGQGLRQSRGVVIASFLLDRANGSRTAAGADHGAGYVVRLSRQLENTPMSRPEVRGLRLTGLRPSPTRHVLVLALVGAPAGRGCDRDRRTDPVYEPPLAVSWPVGRPSDRSP